jgi:hypothetical protein
MDGVYLDRSIGFQDVKRPPIPVSGQARQLNAGRYLVALPAQPIIDVFQTVERNYVNLQ